VNVVIILSSQKLRMLFIFKPVSLSLSLSLSWIIALLLSFMLFKMDEIIWARFFMPKHHMFCLQLCFH
jgi:hypothetical protein